MRLIDADQFGVISLQGKSDDFIEGALFILDKIDEAPTVEERPSGEWLLCKNDNFCKCPECWQIVMSEERSNFCPNCGADMRPKVR